MAQSKNNNTTKQEIVKPKKTLRGGVPINTATQFGQPNGNPRHNGAWKKEDTARYKLEQMLKLTSGELQALAQDEKAPLFERKLATCIAKGQWKEIEGMMNQVYGAPKAVVEQTVVMPKPLIDLTRKSKDGNNNNSKQDS